MSTASPRPRPLLPLILIGAGATFAGLGLGRFAYATLLPQLIEADWFSPAQASYIGAANLLGYLLGALASAPLMRRFSSRALIRINLLVILLGFVASAWPAPFLWFAFWRLLAGISGAALMVVGTASMLGAMQEEDRKRGGPCLFLGIGLGILASATLVPTLLALSLSAAWLGLAAISTLPLGLALWHWPAGIGERRPTPQERAPSPGGAGSDSPRLGRASRHAVVAVMIAYGLDAIGFVPHTLFWVDTLVRQLGQPQGMGTLQWALFGIGALLGPFVAGSLATRLGWHRALVSALALKGLAVALPLLGGGLTGLSLSSLLVGALIPASVALTSGRLAELGGATHHPRLWGLATASFAAAQALGAFVFAELYVRLDYSLVVYALAAIALGVAAVLLLIQPRLDAQPSPYRGT